MKKIRRYTDEERDLPADAEIDTGSPIALLDDVQVETKEAFVKNIRKKIDRQSMTNQFLMVSWYFPKILLFEFLEFFFGSLGSKKR